MATAAEQKILKRRSQLLEMKRKGYTDDFIKFAFFANDPTSDINADLETINTLTGQAQDNQVEVGGRKFDVNTITEQKTYQELKAAETQQSTMKENAKTDLSTKLSTLDELLKDQEGLSAAAGANPLARPFTPISGAKQRFAGKLESILSTDTLDALINAKAEGATFGALSDAELNLLRASASTLAQWAVKDKDGKIVGFDASEEDVKKELGNLRSTTAKAFEDINTETTGATPQANQQQPKPRVSDPAAVQAWLDANPTDPRAEQVRKLLEEQKSPLGDSAALESGSGVQPVEDKSGFSLGKAADKVGEFLGIKKFGEGIGVTIFLNTTEGKDLQKKAAEGDKVALETLQAILDEAPSAKEVIGSAALTALNVASFGTAKGVAGASTVAGKVAAGAAGGTAFGVAGGLEQNKDAAGVAKSGAVGAVVGGAIPAVIAGTKYLSAMRTANRPQDLLDAAGKIVQGEKGDKQAALRTLTSIDTKDVKTYADLNGKLTERMAVLGDKMDELLGRDTTKRTLAQLEKSSTVGGKKVTTNYVSKALDNLDELYTKTDDPENAQRIKNLIEAANKDGLTVKQLNDVAKEYGMEFGSKAFGVTGDARTSVNAVSYENIRKGVKNTLRGLLPDDASKQIDKAFSDNFTTVKLVEKMDEAVNKLTQKLQGRSKLEVAGNIVAKVGDAITGHALRGMISGVLPSNVGLKTMNSLALEKTLQKNLDIINNPAFSKKLGDALLKLGSKANDKIIRTTVLNIIREFQD